MSNYRENEAIIDAQLKRDDLTPEDVLRLTVARRLNGLSDASFAQALGGKSDTPLNFWGKR